MTVKVPDRAKVKGAGTSVIVDLVGFREDNVLPVAAFYGRGDTTVNYLAEVRYPPCQGDVSYAMTRRSRSLRDSPTRAMYMTLREDDVQTNPPRLPFVVDNRSKRVRTNGDDCNAERLAHFPSGQVRNRHIEVPSKLLFEG